MTDNLAAGPPLLGTPLPIDPGTVQPIAVQRPADPDADWDTLRTRILAACGSPAPGWSDQNPVDPGVTLAEAAAFGLADLHHRTSQRAPGWPVEVPAWLPADRRHWASGLLPDGVSDLGAGGGLDDPSWLAGLAAALASPAPPSAGAGSTALVLEPLIRACAAPDQAVSLLVGAPWAGVFSTAQVPVVIRLMRARLLRRHAHELAGLVAAAVDVQAAGGGSVAERDARAVAELGSLTVRGASGTPEGLPRLWPEELAALVRRERRRRSVRVVLDRLAEVRAATDPDAAAAVRARLAAPEHDLTAEEVVAAMAAAHQPPGSVPEDYETPDGVTRLWPPHPIQALTCEPVTAQDYARRARAHPQVGRAWAIPGRLPGVSWDGRVVTAADDRAGTVTLVVERVTGSSATAGFLRAVLATAIGSEVVQPHPTWRDDLAALDPRRLIGDEVGAALLREVDVVLQGKLVTGVDADRAGTVAGALARVSELFAVGPGRHRPAAPAPDGSGRPTPGTAAGSVTSIGGPWPRIEQPSAGWTPGRPIRFSDVVEALADDPTVLGVEDLAVTVADGPVTDSAAGSVAIPPDAVPRLGDVHCLRVRFVLIGGCGIA